MGLHKALAAMRKDLPHVKKGKKGYNYKYADLNSCHEAIDPVLEDHGFLWITVPRTTDDGRVGVEYSLVHLASGESIKADLFLPVSEADPQKAGSAITYARRYALAAVGLFTEEDDDAAKASKPRAKRANPGTKNYLSECNRVVGAGCRLDPRLPIGVA